MSPTVELPNRVFVYGDHTFPDPGSQYAIEQIKATLAMTFPEIANAEVLEETQPDGSFRVEFRKSAGKKGAG